jgi:rhodanese-related sulfurtransferase
VGFFIRTASTDATTLAQRLRDRSLHILDVRQPAEWRHGHIHGAHNLPLMQLKRRLATLPQDKTIVTVCGMHAWTKAGLPVEKARRR